MERQTMRLGVEEIACTLSLLGNPDAAGGYLFAVFGERPLDEVRGRLWSAAHSLVARGLFALESSPQPLSALPVASMGSLDKDLASLVMPLLSYDIHIRCSISMPNIDEQLLSFFIQNNEIIEVASERHIVAILSRINEVNELVSRCRAFCSVENELSDGGDFPSVVISADLFAELRTNRDESMSRRLGVIGLSQSQVELLVDAFDSEKARGSVLRVERRPNQLIADKGFLFLITAKTCLIFEVLSSSESSVRIHFGRPNSFDRILRKLLTHDTHV